MDYRSLTDEQLVDTLADFSAVIKAQKAMEDDCRAELLRRHLETGETSLAGTKGATTLKRAPLSLAWLKKEHGYEAADIPADCVSEKVVPDVQWDRVLAWLGEGVKPPFTLSFKAAKEAA